MTRRRFKYFSVFIFLISFSAFNLISCSTVPSVVPENESETSNEILNRSLVESQHMIETLSVKISQLEGNVSSLNEKLTLTQNTINQVMAQQKANEPTAIINHPSKNSGISTHPPLAVDDPEQGFSQDESIQIFKRAMITHDSQKYSDATLAFSDFLERYPDHALAGSAQFYLGESYFNRKEWKFALIEYEKVLASYPRSSYISDSLRKISIIEDFLKKPHDAARHRQMLTSLFPQTPASLMTEFEKKPSESTHPQEEITTLDL